MIGFLGTLFMVVLCLILMVLAVLIVAFFKAKDWLLRVLGINKPHASSSSESGSGAKTAPRRKIFDDDEGEYVDFEEIK
jgi:hypothetical protein